MLKAYNQEETLDEKELASDREFLSDAYFFLKERTGVNEVLKPEEVYDRFMEHMRYHDTNEITTLRDLEYAQNASIEGKQNFARLIDAYDKVDTSLSWKMVGDYAEGLATAPSTYIGLATGGTGKAAAVAGTQAAKLGIRKILSNAASSAVGRAAITEGAIGTVQGGLGEATRVITGAQDEFTGIRTAVSGAANAVGAGVLTGALNKFGGKVASRDVKQKAANELLEKSRLAENEKANKATLVTKTVLHNAPKEKIKEIKDSLNALDPMKVKQGRQLKQDLMPGDTLEATLGVDVIDNITAAAIAISDQIVLAKGDRITTGIFNLMKEGKLSDLTKVNQILKEHNLTMDQFQLIYMATVSDAARTLQAAGTVAKKVEAQDALDRLLDGVDQLNYTGKTPLTREQAMIFTDPVESEAKKSFLRSTYEKSQDLDRLGVGAMTAQPATTMRNNAGGGFRMAVDATVRVMDNAIEKYVWSKSTDVQKLRHVQANLIQKFGINKSNNIMGEAANNPELLQKLFKEYGESPQAAKSIFSGVGDMSKYMFDPAEGKVVRTLFEENFPAEAANLFRQQADLAATVGEESTMARWGRKVNILNTMSDNMFKQGMLSASLSRRISDAGLPVTSEIRTTLLKNKIMETSSLQNAENIINNASPDMLNKLFKQYGLDKKKTVNLNDLIATGNFNEIPTEVYKGAVKDAYELTYQEGMQGKGMGRQAARFFIDLQKKVPFVISSVLPFPRFVANQLKFQYEHMPLMAPMALGLPLLTGNKALVRERLPKQLAGIGMLTAAYMWRAKQGENAEWFEIKKGDDYYINGKAIYGPMAPFMVVADYMYRSFNGEVPVKSGKYYGRAFLESTLGSTFRTGLGLTMLDASFKDDIFSPNREAAQFLGNLFGRYTIPISPVKDVYSQFDRQSRMVPATSTGDEVNWWEYIHTVATKNLPDLPLSSWGLSDKKTDYDKPAYSPFQEGPIYSINPIEKQLLGATTVRKNKLQKEMARLGLTYGDIYTRDSDDKIDYYTRQELSRGGNTGYNMARDLTNFINSDVYQNSTALEQNAFLINVARSKVEKAKKVAKIRLTNEAKRAGLPYSRNQLAQWDALNSLKQKRVNEILLRDHGMDSVSKNKDKSIIVNNRTINVMQWAADLGSKLKDRP